MPTGSVSRDSIAKCTANNDVYAMIRNPTAKPASPSQKKVDTIESAQAQMERRAMQFLGKEVSKNFVVVARVGKFMFLAITLPPCIFFYGVPKWILAEAVPYMFQKMRKAALGIANLLKSEDKKPGIINTLREGLKTLSTKAIEYMKWVNKASKALFVHLKHQVVSIGYRLLQPYFPIANQSAQIAQKVTEMLAKTYAKGDKHAALAKEFATMLWKTAKQEMANHFQPYMDLVKNRYNSFRKTIQKAIEIPRQRLEKFKTSIVKRLKKTNEVFKTIGLTITKNVAIPVAMFSAITKPIVEWMTPRFQWMANTFNRNKESLVESISKRFEQISSFIQNIANGIKESANASKNAIVNFTKSLFEITLAPFIKGFFNPESGFKSKYKQFFSNNAKRFKQLKEKVVHFIADQKQKAKNRLLAMWNSIVNQILLFPSRLWNLIKLSYRFMVTCLDSIGLFFQWLAVWSKILVRLAIQETRSRVASMQQSFSLTESDKSPTEQEK